MENTMKVKAIWEFEVDTEDFSDEFVDVEGLAKDLTQREMENLLQNQEIASEDFLYELENENQLAIEEEKTDDEQSELTPVTRKDEEPTKDKKKRKR